MAKFPKPLLLPNQVFQSRTKRHHEVISAVKLGIYFRLFVIFFELLGVALIKSSVLFLDAVSSLADVGSSLFLILCMKLAKRPPDYDHPFGHGRFEPVGGMLLGILLAFVGIVMFIQQMLGTFHQDNTFEMHPLGWTFPAIAMIVLEIAYRKMMSTATKQHSPALAADAMHYRIDSLTSFCATLVLILVTFVPEWGAVIDHAGALLIALFMIGIGLSAAYENFNQLMDKIPDPQFFNLVRQAAFRVSGVQATEKIRIQQYGPDAHVDIDIEVHPSLAVDKAHKISQQVRLEIQKAWPSVRDVTVHIEPYYPNDH